MATNDENVRQGWVILKLPSDFLNTHRQSPKSNIYANRFLMLSMSSLRFFHTQPLCDIDLEQCSDLDFEIDLESIRSVNLLPDEGSSSTGFEVEAEDRQYEIRCNISYDTNDWIFSIIEARTVHLKKLESEPNLHSKMKRKYSSSRTIRRVLENVVQKFTRNSMHTENSDFLSTEQISCVLRLESLLLTKVDIAWHIASAILDSIGYLPIEYRNERAKQLGQSLSLWLGEKNSSPGNDSNDIIINDEYYANRLATNKTILQQWIEVSLVKEFKRSCVFSVPSEEKENLNESESKHCSSRGSLLNRSVKRSYSIEASREFTDSDDDDDCDDDTEVVHIVNVESMDRNNNYDRFSAASSSPLSNFITREKSLSDVMTTSATSMSMTIRSMESYDESHHLIADKNNPIETRVRESKESSVSILDAGLITPLRSTSKSDSDHNQIEKLYVQQSSSSSSSNNGSKSSTQNNTPRMDATIDDHNYTAKLPISSNPNNSIMTSSQSAAVNTRNNTTAMATAAATGSTSMLFRGDFVETLFITNFMKASALSSGLLSSLLLPTLLAVAAPPDRMTYSPPTPEANSSSGGNNSHHLTTHSTSTHTTNPTILSSNGHHQSSSSSSYSNDNTYSNHSNNGVNGNSSYTNNNQIGRDSGTLSSNDEVEVEVEGNLFLRTGRKLMNQSHMSPPHRKNFLNFFTADDNALSTFEPSSFFGQNKQQTTPQNHLTTSPLNTTTASGELDSTTSIVMNRSRASSPTTEFDVHLQLPPSVDVNDISQTMSSIQTQFSDDRNRSSSDTSARISRSSTSSSSSYGNVNSRTASPFSSPLLSARSLPSSRSSFHKDNELLMHYKTTSSPNMKSKDTKLISSVNNTPPNELLPKSVDTNNANATVMSACSLIFQQLNSSKQSIPTSMRLLLSSLRKLTIEKHDHTTNTSGSSNNNSNSHDIGIFESGSRVERPEYGIYLCCSAALIVLRLLCPAIMCPMECGAWRAAEKSVASVGPSERPNLWRSAAIRVLQEAVPVAVPATHSQEISPQISSSPSTATSTFLNPLAAVIELTKGAAANATSNNNLPCITAASLEPCTAAMILIAHSLMEGSSMILLGDPKSVVWGGTDEELRAIYSVAEEVANLIPISKATEILTLHSSSCKTLLEPSMEANLNSAATRKILTQVAKILQSCANLSCQAEEDDREGVIRDTASLQSNGLIITSSSSPTTEEESTLPLPSTEISIPSFDSSYLHPHHPPHDLPCPLPPSLSTMEQSSSFPLPPSLPTSTSPPVMFTTSMTKQGSPVSPSAVKYDVKLFQQENSKFLKSYYYEISSSIGTTASSVTTTTTALGNNIMNTHCKKSH